MPVNQEGTKPPPSAPSNFDVVGAPANTKRQREMSMTHPVIDGPRVSFARRLDLHHDNTSFPARYLDGTVNLTE
jgi:hypothetical protein